jgi:hypothetical protein
MSGLIFAALYVAFKVLFSNTEPVAAVEMTLSFLWYWHMTFAVIKAIIWIFIPIFGGLMLGAGNDKEKAAGAAIIAVSPIFLVLFSISSALFLCGVYGVNSGIQDGSVINQSHVVVGLILYGLAVLLQMKSKNSSNSND